MPPKHISKVFLFGREFTVTSIIQYGEVLRFIGEKFDIPTFSRLRQVWRDQEAGNIDGMVIGLQIYNTTTNECVYDNAELVVRLTSGNCQAGETQRYIKGCDAFRRPTKINYWELTFNKIEEPHEQAKIIRKVPMKLLSQQRG